MERRVTCMPQRFLRCLNRRELARWPQYGGRVFTDAAGRPQVHLNVFGYFLFWTAFYVLRGGQTTRHDVAPAYAQPRYGHLTPSLGTVRKACNPLPPLGIQPPDVAPQGPLL